MKEVKAYAEARKDSYTHTLAPWNQHYITEEYLQKCKEQYQHVGRAQRGAITSNVTPLAATAKPVLAGLLTGDGESRGPNGERLLKPVATHRVHGPQAAGENPEIVM